MAAPFAPATASENPRFQIPTWMSSLAAVWARDKLLMKGGVGKGCCRGRGEERQAPVTNGFL